MHIILWVKCMDKKDRESNFNHLVEINERKTLVVSGVKKLESFDSKEFFLESVMGYILIKGQGLELIKLDTLLHICEGFNITRGEFFKDAMFDTAEQD